MEIIGRYRLIRTYWVHSGQMSEPKVLDRVRRTLLPYRGSSEARAEWEPRLERNAALGKWQRFKSQVRDQDSFERQQRMADRLLDRHADCAQLAAIFGRDDYYSRVFLRDIALGAATNIALNNNYVAGTSGNAIAARYQSALSKTINNVYFFISSYTGNAALVTDINLELRPENSAGATTPNTASLTESKTVNPASATGWINSSGWTSVLSAVSRNFFIVGDANGGATNLANVTRSLASLFDVGGTNGNIQPSRFMTASTTGGWASGNTASNGCPCIVLAFSDGSVFGNPITTATTPSSTTHQRGLLITTSGIINSFKIWGMEWVTSTANTSGIKIFTGSTAPNGTADHTSTDIVYDDTGARIGCMTSAGATYTMSAGTQYRTVATYSAASNSGPRRVDIGTGSDSNLILAMPGGGQFYYTEDDGASSWAGDLTTSLPTIGLMVDGETAAAAGGGAYILGC